MQLGIDGEVRSAGKRNLRRRLIRWAAQNETLVTDDMGILITRKSLSDICKRGMAVRV